MLFISPRDCYLICHALSWNDFNVIVSFNFLDWFYITWRHIWNYDNVSCCFEYYCVLVWVQDKSVSIIFLILYIHVTNILCAGMKPLIILSSMASVWDLPYLVGTDTGFGTKKKKKSGTCKWRQKDVRNDSLCSLRLPFSLFSCRWTQLAEHTHTHCSLYRQQPTQQHNNSTGHHSTSKLSSPFHSLIQENQEDGSHSGIYWSVLRYFNPHYD